MYIKRFNNYPFFKTRFMKTKEIYLGILILLISLSSCEKLDILKPARIIEEEAVMKAEIDDEAWQAVNPEALIIKNKITITGISIGDEVINIELNADTVGPYFLNPSLLSAVSYMGASDGSEVAYTSNNLLEINGSVYIIEIDSLLKTLSGIFEFEVYRSADGKSKYISKGIIKNIPYYTSIPLETWHSFKGTIDSSNAIVATTITADDNGSSISILGLDNRVEAVQINIANNATEGTYSIGMGTKAAFMYDYPNDSIGLSAKSGSVTITRHDQILNILEGSFNFEAEGTIGNEDTTITIMNGYFSVRYF
jgi:hypothetical protein